MKLHTENFSGNLHEAAVTINKLGWADFVMQMESSGGNTIVVFQMPNSMVHSIRKNSRSYVSDPHHDDCKEIYLGN